MASGGPAFHVSRPGWPRRATCRPDRAPAPASATSRVRRRGCHGSARRVRPRHDDSAVRHEPADAAHCPASRRASARSTGASVLMPVSSTNSARQPKPTMLSRDLFDHRLEYRRRQAAAAGIFDKRRIMTVTHRRPDQRIDAIGDPRGQPFGLDAVGIHRQMKAVLLGGGADRQNRGGAIADAARDLVPASGVR